MVFGRGGTAAPAFSFGGGGRDKRKAPGKITFAQPRGLTDIKLH